MPITLLALAALLASPSPPALAPQGELFQTAHCPIPQYWSRSWDIAVDLDGNDAPDLVGHDFYSDSTGYYVDVNGYLGDGRGGFELAWEFRLDVGTYTASSRSDMVSANLNGDDRTDFVLSAGFGTWCFTADPSDPYGLPDFYGYVNRGVKEIVAADLDADGLDDLFFGEFQGMIVFNHGPHQLVSVQTTVSDLVNSPPPIIAELNGDGRPDILVTHYTSTSIYPVAGGVVFDPIVLPFSAHRSWMRLAAGDVDQDGDIDLVQFDNQQERHRVIRRIGPADYSIEAWAPGGPATQLYDVDDDGDLDGVALEEDLVTDLYEFRISLNDGTGSFGPALRVGTQYGSQVAGVFDVDGDGDRDIVGGACILFNLAEVGAPYCPSSATAPALLGASGTASVTRNNLVLEGTQLPPSSFGHTFFGPGTQVTPLGGGTLCVGGAWVRRLPVVAADASGSSSVAFDFASLPSQGAGACLPGDTRYFQIWYRDPQTFSNLTNAYAITFAP